MRFDRHPHRLEPYRWTARKLALAASRPERQRRKEQERLPLLASLQPPAPAPAFDLEAEQRARDAAHARSIQTMRDLQAKHWRHGRALYFAADPATRARIQANWLAWTGPAKPGYFIYVVEVATGAYEARAQRMREKYAALRRTIATQLDAELAAQGRLTF